MEGVVFSLLGKTGIIAIAVAISPILIPRDAQAADEKWCGDFFTHYPAQFPPFRVCYSRDETQIHDYGIYHSLLGIGYNDEISSATISPGSECIVTQDSDFDGASLLIRHGATPGYTHVTGGIADAMIVSPSNLPIQLDVYGWNDEIYSIHCNRLFHFNPPKVREGVVEVFEHAYFGGRSFSFAIPYTQGRRPWYYEIPADNSWNDVISSLRMGQDVSCRFYYHVGRGGQISDYGSRFQAFTYQYPDFESTGDGAMNDNISAIECWRQ